MASRWYEIDFNWYGIWLMNKFGLARDIYRVKLSALKTLTAPDNDEANAPAVGATPATKLVSA